MTDSPDPSLRDLAILLNRGSRALMRRFESRTGDGSLSSTQWLTLVMLYRHGAMRQARLAELLWVEPISVSRTLDRMQRDGWVCRDPDPTDRRAHLVRVTDRAAAALAGFDAAAGDILAEAFAGFDSPDRRTLAALLSRLNDNLGVPANCGAATHQDHEQ